jgi:drug/metabolite transporter (DMT)-like permease
MNETIPYLGQTLALLSAILWGFAVILFKKSGETVHPIALNIFKDLLAMVLFLPTLWIAGGTLIRQIPSSEYLLFFLSGVLGIAIGDTCFFKSLNRLGAGWSAIVSCMYSPFMIGLSVIWLGEKLTLLQVFGVLLIVSAVLSTIRVNEKENLSRRDLFWGIVWGIAATAAMAFGIVIIKPLLEQSPLLWAVEVRLIAGFVSLALITVSFPSGRRAISTLFSVRSWIYTCSGSFIGAYLAMLTWLGGMKFTQISLASALNQTSTVFVFVFAALFLHEPITPRRTVAILMAVSGACLIFLS